ncbi:MAG: alpha-1,2-fucosyltransferase [Bacteroidia bacterium]
MIIVNLKGGLGNQMFQYAAGLALAEKHHVDLKLDFAFLEKSTGSAEFTKRKFELEIFNVNFQLASAEEIHAFKGNQQKISYRVKRKFFPSLIRKKNYRYDQLNFDPAFSLLGNQVYLDGYFQSAKYFLNAEKKIRSQFHFKNPPAGKNKVLAEEISSCNSVSIHVRRGDYLSEINRGLFGNICTLDYYSKAIAIIQNEISSPHFYIFSDDVAWVKENIKTDSPMTYVDFNTGENSFEDMRLMSLCWNNIIANSSFSWWAAWLNENVAKKIIAPSEWINDPDCVIEDVIPKTWQRT